MLSETNKIKLDSSVENLLECLSFHACLMATYKCGVPTAYEAHTEKTLKIAIILEKLSTFIAHSQELTFFTIQPKGETK